MLSIIVLRSKRKRFTKYFYYTIMEVMTPASKNRICRNIHYICNNKRAKHYFSFFVNINLSQYYSKKPNNYLIYQSIKKPGGLDLQGFRGSERLFVFDEGDLIYAICGGSWLVLMLYGVWIVWIIWVSAGNGGQGFTGERCLVYWGFFFPENTISIPFLLAASCLRVFP